MRKVISAVYGADGAFVDCTQVVRNYLKQQAEFIASNALAGDPIYGTPKTLFIEYEDGSRHSVPEGCLVGRPTTVATQPSCNLRFKIYQIYFNESQSSGLEYTPFFNNHCTVYFENSVIRSLVEEGAHLGSDYFGVVSYQIRHKLRTWNEHWGSHGQLVNLSARSFSPRAFEEEVQRQRVDVMGFGQHPPHDPIALAEHFHPGLSLHFRRIMASIGYDWKPTQFAHVFYFNYFVAKPELYQRYVNEMLVPAMKVMDSMPELMADSHYGNPLPENLRVRFGVPFYPFHPFLCERLFSYFAHLHGLRCGHF
jgi:hypothetical protein